jgi:hypothetical protein
MVTKICSNNIALNLSYMKHLVLIDNPNNIGE